MESSKQHHLSHVELILLDYFRRLPDPSKTAILDLIITQAASAAPPIDNVIRFPVKTTA